MQARSILRRTSSASAGDLPDEDSLPAVDAPISQRSCSLGARVGPPAGLAPRNSDADAASTGGGGYYTGTPRATGEATGFADVPTITDEDAEVMLQEFMLV